MENLKFLNMAISDKREAIKVKENEIYNFEISADDHIDDFDNMLDECYPSLFHLLPSRILSKCDPIAYAEGLADYVDSLDCSEDEKFQALETDLLELENDLEDLISEVKEIEGLV